MKLTLLIMIVLSHSVLWANNSDVYMDTRTGILWQDNKDAKSIKQDWSGAKSYCKDLSLSGYSDWHLPSINELETLSNDDKSSPAIISGIKNIISSFYWSSSANVNNAKSAWYVYFGNGSSNSSNKDYKSYVRCARSGQLKNLTFESTLNRFVSKALAGIKKPQLSLDLVKDEFETSSEFKQRVAKAKKAQKSRIKKFQKSYTQAKKKAKAGAIKKALQTTWGKPLLSGLHYDADNGYFVANITFEAKKSFSKKVAIKVDRKHARAFKQQFSSLRPQAVFDYDGKSVSLKDIRVPFKNKQFYAQFTDVTLDDTRLAVNIKADALKLDDSVDSSIHVAKSSVSQFDASGLTNFRELDKLLAKSKQVRINKRRWLFVVGIEKYEYTDNISYATRSAEMFVKSTQKRLGVPKENSYVMINTGATQAKIKTNLKKMLRRISKGDTIYFYYNGHGIPVPSLDNEAFMLTADTEPDFVQDEKFFSLQNIYTKLSESKAKKVVAVVDSCFSGVTDGKSVLKGVAATRLVAKKVSFNHKKMVVLSAGTSKQYSNGYNKKGHRLFSFYVMKNIIEGKTDVKSLYKKVKSQTYDTSIKEYGDSRTQSPSFDGNLGLKL
jgi:hypothetical protein